MRSFTLLLALGALHATGWAQCQIQNFQITADCAFDAPEATVALGGGQPPYDLVFTGTNGVNVYRQSEQNGPYTTNVGDFINTVLVPPVNLTVTDANGCTISASASFQLHVLALPTVWFERGCASATSELYWSGTYFHWEVNTGPFPDGQPDPCAGSTYTYTIVDSQTWSTVASGSLSADWSQLPNGFWKYNIAMPHGSYYVSIHPTGNPTGCQNGAVTYCYRDKGAITNPSPTGCGQQFKLKAFLGGPLATNTTLMRDNLRVLGLVPLTEPYTDLGYTYVGGTGGETISPALLAITGSNAIVDWIVIELRSSTLPANVLYAMPALLQRDGDVVSLVGGTWLYTPLDPGSYHVAIHHRNHLGVMSADPLWLNYSPLILQSFATPNFGSGQMSAYGTDARQQNGTYFCLWPGDVTADGEVRYTGSGNDRDAVLQAIGGIVTSNTVANVYDQADINLDGVIKYVGANNDRDIILQTIGGTIPTAVRIQQVP